MKILILVASYPPILDSAARLYSELADGLARRGHTVTVITEHPLPGSPVDPQHPYFLPALNRAVTEQGLQVLRVSPLHFLGRVPGGKAVRFLLSCVLFALRGMMLRKQDVVLVYSPPLFMGVAAHVVALTRRSRFVLNMQDIHPKLLFDSGAITNPFARRLLLAIETLCYRKAHSFIVYSSGNQKYLQRRENTKRINVIPNWIDTSAPIPKKSMEAFRCEHNLTGKFVLVYGGSMGAIQGLEVVVEAAQILRSYQAIVFVIAGQGPSKEKLLRSVAEKELTNVRLLPPLRTELYAQLITSADVGLVTLSGDVPAETVPGKLADLMAKGKPILAAVKSVGDAAAVIDVAGCGLRVEPGDAEAFAAAALRLFSDEALRSELGSRSKIYAERHFSREGCIAAYAAALTAAAGV